MKITVKQASKLLNLSELTVRWGIKNNTLPIGSYIQMPGSKRTVYHISDGQLASYLKITTEELKERMI